MDAPTLYALFFSPCGLAIVALAVCSAVGGALLIRAISLPIGTFSRPRNTRGH